MKLLLAIPFCAGLLIAQDAINFTADVRPWCAGSSHPSDKPCRPVSEMYPLLLLAQNTTDAKAASPAAPAPDIKAQLDAANKQIADLTASNDLLSKLANSYADKYQKCDQSLTIYQIQNPPKDAAKK